MKETAFKLREAIIAKLTEAGVTGVAPVYDTFAPDGAPYPYILIGSIFDSPSASSTKTDFFTEAFAVIDVVTGFDSRGGRKQSEDITGLVLEALIPISPADYLDLGPDFQVCDVTKEGSKPLTARTETKYIYRKLSTLRFHIQQLTY